MRRKIAPVTALRNHAHRARNLWFPEFPPQRCLAIFVVQRLFSGRINTILRPERTCSPRGINVSSL